MNQLISHLSVDTYFVTKPSAEADLFLSPRQLRILRFIRPLRGCFDEQWILGTPKAFDSLFVDYRTSITQSQTASSGFASRKSTQYPTFYGATSGVPALHEDP